MLNKIYYELMDSSDFIYLGGPGFSPAMVAFDYNLNIIAVGTPEKAKLKGILRGCDSPALINARNLCQEIVKTHNNLLEKALSD